MNEEGWPLIGGVPEIIFKDPSFAKKYFGCAICLKITWNPASCCAQGHMFCLSCISTCWEDVQKWGLPLRCPTCQGAAHKPQPLGDFNLKNIFQNQRLHCLSWKEGDDEDEGVRYIGVLVPAQGLKRKKMEEALPAPRDTCCWYLCIFALF